MVSTAARRDRQVTGCMVWPVTLGYVEANRLLIGWCELRQAFHHFRGERTQSAKILDQPIGLRSGERRQRWRDRELKC